MLSRKIVNCLAALAFTAALTACGGGAGSDKPVQATAAVESAGKQALAVPPVGQFAANGWFYNPAEGGTGFMFEAQGNRGFVAFFMYEDGTGKPLWYAANGAFTGIEGGYSFTGDLRYYTQGQPAWSPTYKGPGSRSVGTVQINFTGNNAAVQLPGGRNIAAIRYDFAGLNGTSNATVPEVGWYWNPAEGGRGYAIEVQNNKLFMAMFHYNEDGTPTWNVVEGNIGTGSVSDQFQLFTGGQSLTSAYRGPTRVADLGAYTLSFRNPCAGQVQLAGAPAVSVRRYFFGDLPAGSECRTVTAGIPDVPGVQVGPAQLQPGDSIYGRIDTAGDVDAYGINLTAGVTYRFDLRGASTANGTLVDPLLAVHDATLQKVAENNDIAAGQLDAGLSFTPATTGIYYLAAQANGAGTGTFLLSTSGVAAGLAAQPVPALASYAGTVTGSLSGGRAGNVTLVIDNNGKLTGSVVLAQNPGVTLVVSGTVAVGGTVSFTATSPAVGLTFTGFLGPQGKLYGSWSDGGSASGAVFGSRPITQTMPQPPVLDWFVGDKGGPGNGLGTGARFAYLSKLALDRAGNAWVFDYVGNATLALKKISVSGEVSLVASWNTEQVAAGTAVGLRDPLPMVVDSAGQLYVADSASATIRKISPTGVISTYAGTSGLRGSADGNLTQALFLSPGALAIDRNDNLYVVDAGVRVRKVSAAGVVTTVTAGTPVYGYASDSVPPLDGPPGTATFASIRHIAVDDSGTVYLTDDASTVRQITASGNVSTLAGLAWAQGFADGQGASARFKSLAGIAVNPAAGLFVADNGGRTIRNVSKTGLVTTVAGAAGVYGTVDGPALDARLAPDELAVSAAGDVVFTENGGSSLRVLSAAGVVSTRAGSRAQSASTDGVGEAARFRSVGRMTADPSGNVYMVDESGQDASIRKITPAGVVTTLTALPTRPVLTDAYISRGGLASDASGNLYVGDAPNATVLKVTPAGVVSVLAGSSQQTGTTDGAAGTARFTTPRDVVIDGLGNVYVADDVVVRKITPAGVVSTLAGAKGRNSTIDGRGAAAGFSVIKALAVESSGRYLYIADGQVIRRLEPATGLVTTVAGTVSQSGSTDAVGYDARFIFPRTLAIDAAGTVYISDGPTIRRLSASGAVTTLVGSPDTVNFRAGVLPGQIGEPAGLAVSGSTLYASMFGGVAVVRNLP